MAENRGGVTYRRVVSRCFLLQPQGAGAVVRLHTHRVRLEARVASEAVLRLGLQVRGKSISRTKKHKSWYVGPTRALHPRRSRGTRSTDESSAPFLRTNSQARADEPAVKPGTWGKLETDLPTKMTALAESSLSLWRCR